MSCQETIERQNEFEFFQQLLEHMSAPECCGPVNRIGFTQSSLIALAVGIRQLGLDEDEFLAQFEPVKIDSGTESFAMCSKHWIVFSKYIGTEAVKIKNEALGQLAYYIFRVVCLNNDWDYKEVLNYIKTANDIKEDK